MLVFAAFTALQSRFMPKPRPKPAVVASADSASPAGVDSASRGNVPLASVASVPVVALATTAPVAPRTVVIETPLYRATFSNIGARLQSVELKRYAAAWGASRFGDNPGRRPKHGDEVPVGDRVELRGAPAFAFDLGSGPALRSLASTPFEVHDSTDAAGTVLAVTFVARDSSGSEVRQTWRADPETYLLAFDVTVAGTAAAPRDWSLTTRSWPLVSEANPDLEKKMVRSIGLVGKNLHRDGAEGMVNKGDKLREGAAHWVGVQSHYFLSVVAPVGAEGRATVSRATNYTLTDEEKSHVPANTKPIQPIAEGTLVMAEPSTGHQRFAVYFGPADYFSIAKLSGAGKAGSLEIEKAVDLGASWLMPFSYPLLQLLRLLYSWVKNYGAAIFLLATVVRLVLHPLNMASMKSMRAMQRLQPEMERIREKYKNKPEALNAAVMALYKENKVNPAGGCLPMLLQMPLFFALYAVLNSAIDLRQAPFIGWIHDLSAPDHLFSVAGFPIHLLPLIMAATGFLQQKLTPTPAAQATQMYLMNFFMLFIFYGLPSGLVFYWTVMNLYTALQQWLAIRGDNGVVVPVVTGSPRGKS